jgi:hypothetical protein
MAAVLSELSAAESTQDGQGPTQERIRRAREAVMERLGGALEESLAIASTDTEALLARVGARTALMYQCRRESSRWSIHVVLVDRGAPVCVAGVDLAADDDSDWMNPTGVLDALGSGEAERISAVHALPLLDEVWSTLAKALLPSQLTDALVRGEEPVDLLIVPDGPLASLPFAGLPLPDGRRLVDGARISLAPSLSLLGEPEHERASEPLLTIVTHLDDRSLAGVTQEISALSKLAGDTAVRSSATRAELESALAASPPAQAALISAHGSREADMHANALHLRDGSVLSAAGALELRWPASVVLGSCWLAGVNVGEGRDPFGFPIACLLRGAREVVGSLAPSADEQAGELLAALSTRVVSGESCASALREATLARDGPHSGTPQEWASLATWTRAGAPAPVKSGQGHWKPDGAPWDEGDPPARLADILARADHGAPPTTRAMKLTRRWAWGAAAVAIAVTGGYLKSARQEEQSLARHGFMGVALSETTGGPAVTAVLRDGPAARAGIGPGALLLAVDGRAVSSVAEAQALIAAHAAGTRVRVELLADGHTRTASVTLESEP